MKFQKELDKLTKFSVHFFLVLPLICSARNVRIEPDYDFGGGAGGPMTSARWGILAISICVWIFPIPIAFIKERYGKSAGWTYWKWWFFLSVTAFIGMGITNEPWVGFFLMLGVTVAGFFIRTTDEVVSDIVESGKKDTRFNEVNSESVDTDVYSKGVRKNVQKVTSENAVAKNQSVSSSHPSPVKQSSHPAPELYKGGMIYMISGRPHQFNGSEFERVDTDESVVINGKTLVWNGKIFAAKD